jgi:uncharacterized protein YndB with AHSA1/START domain
MPQFGAMTFDTKGDRELVATRSFNAPKALVWQALTTPALIKQWLGAFKDWSMPHCEFDARVGGKYRYEWRNAANGATMAMGGTFLEVDPPHRMVATELFDDAWYEGGAEVMQVLTEAGGRTTLTVTVKYISTAVRDEVFAGPAPTGMSAGYDAMERLLAGME